MLDISTYNSTDMYTYMYSVGQKNWPRIFYR